MDPSRAGWDRPSCTSLAWFEANLQAAGSRPRGSRAINGRRRRPIGHRMRSCAASRYPATRSADSPRTPLLVEQIPCQLRLSYFLFVSKSARRSRRGNCRRPRLLLAHSTCRHDLERRSRGPQLGRGYCRALRVIMRQLAQPFSDRPRQISRALQVGDRRGEMSQACLSASRTHLPLPDTTGLPGMPEKGCRYSLPANRPANGSPPVRALRSDLREVRRRCRLNLDAGVRA